jgi:alkane 1-monooxygenase
LGIFYLLHGVNGVFWFIVHGFTSILILETINYIEHYGLLRQEVSSGSILSKNQGVYEPVDIRHSWNAPQTVSNLLLFKLQRHSDHHENPIKPY